MNISVVIPTYNEEKYLGKCLAALTETNADYELIVVDSCSTDRTRDIAKRYGARIFLDDRNGISPARNLGLRNAKGKMVAFLDADSVPCPGWLDIIEKRGRGLVGMGGPVLYEGRKVYNIYSHAVFALNPLLRPFGRFFLSGNNSAYDRKAFSSIGGWPNVVCEDAALIRWIGSLGKLARFEPEMKVTLSDRQFRKHGFLKTVLKWGRANIKILAGQGIHSSAYDTQLKKTR